MELDLTNKHVIIPIGAAGFCFVIVPNSRFDWHRVFLPKILKILRGKTGLTNSQVWRGGNYGTETPTNAGALKMFQRDLNSSNPRLWIEFDGTNAKILIDGQVK